MSKWGKVSRRRQKEQKFRQPKNHYNEHHVYPGSRRKKGDLGKFKVLCDSLRLVVEIEKHNAWHHLFLNLFPEEVILLIKKAGRAGKYGVTDLILFIKQNLHPKQSVISVTRDDLEAWKKNFGRQAIMNHVSLHSIRKTIRRDWMYPGVHATVAPSGQIVRMVIYLPKIIKIGFRGIRVVSFKGGQLLKLT